MPIRLRIGRGRLGTNNVRRGLSRGQALKNLAKASRRIGVAPKRRVRRRRTNLIKISSNLYIRPKRRVRRKR